MLVKFIRTRCRDAVSTMFLWLCLSTTSVRRVGLQRWKPNICSICSYKMRTTILQFFLNFGKENHVPLHLDCKLYLRVITQYLLIGQHTIFVVGRHQMKSRKKVLMGKVETVKYYHSFFLSFQELIRGYDRK